VTGAAASRPNPAPWTATLTRLDLFSILVLLVGVLYVALAWTPSSYGVALTALGLPDEGLVAGVPRPIRSDEWMVWTPYVQIALENGFQRHDALSIYGEDLRNFNGLPLLDWALPFKPQFWGFFIADPAYAFSFSHAIFIVLFLIGYHRLLMGFGFARSWSAAGSLLLFFTSYAQYTGGRRPGRCWRSSPGFCWPSQAPGPGWRGGRCVSPSSRGWCPSGCSATSIRRSSFRWPLPAGCCCWRSTLGSWRRAFCCPVSPAPPPDWASSICIWPIRSG